MILATEPIEAGLARQIADTLGVTAMPTILVGGDGVSLALATRLERRGEFVAIVESDEEHPVEASEHGYPGREGDSTEAAVLERAGIHEAKRVITLSDDDHVNRFFCQVGRTAFGIDDVFARGNEPGTVEAIESLSVTASTTPSPPRSRTTTRSSGRNSPTGETILEEGHDIQEIEVIAAGLVGKTISNVNDQIPGGCLGAQVGRWPTGRVQEPDQALEHGEGRRRGGKNGGQGGPLA